MRIVIGWGGEVVRIVIGVVRIVIEGSAHSDQG